MADTGHHRVVLFDPAGHLIRTASSGSVPLVAPYAVVAVPGGFDVLEAQTGTIDHFDAAGRFIARVAQDSALRIGRSLAVGPDGRFYIANPLTNSIVVLTPDGRVARQMTSLLGAGQGQFNQVSDVVTGATGALYVLDNLNNRIEALTATGTFIAQWSVPTSDTLHSVHLLSLSDGRLLAGDPTGALLIYPHGGGTPTRRPLLLNGRPLAASEVQIVGLTRSPQGEILATDSRGGRIFVVTLRG